MFDFLRSVCWSCRCEGYLALFRMHGLFSKLIPYNMLIVSWWNHFCLCATFIVVCKCILILCILKSVYAEHNVSVLCWLTCAMHRMSYWGHLLSVIHKKLCTSTYVTYKCIRFGCVALVGTRNKIKILNLINKIFFLKLQLQGQVSITSGLLKFS